MYEKIIICDRASENRGKYDGNNFYFQANIQHENFQLCCPSVGRLITGRLNTKNVISE